MLIPCPFSSNCPSDPENPTGTALGNFSSEATDGPVFVAVSYASGSVVPPLGTPVTNPVIGIGTGTTPINAQVNANYNSIANTARGPSNSGGSSGPNENNQGHPSEWFENTEQTCTVTLPDGTEHSYTVPAGTILDQNQASADAQAMELACLLAHQTGVVLPDLALDFCTLESANVSILATGGTPPYNYAIVSGSLPPGMTLVSGQTNAVAISGSCDVAGDYQFTIGVEDSLGNTQSKSYTASVMGLTGSFPDEGNVGQAYAYQFTAAGGTAPYTFEVSNGDLPDGLILSESGAVTGTPTEVTNETVTIKTTDDDGRECYEAVDFSVAGELPQFTLQPVSGFQLAGQKHTLSADAINGTVAYQWFENGAEIPGETNATLNIYPAGGTVGTYWVVATNEAGSTESTHVVVYGWFIFGFVNNWDEWDVVNPPPPDLPNGSADPTLDIFSTAIDVAPYETASFHFDTASASAITFHVDVSLFIADLNLTGADLTEVVVKVDNVTQFTYARSTDNIGTYDHDAVTDINIPSGSHTVKVTVTTRAVTFFDDGMGNITNAYAETYTIMTIPTPPDDLVLSWS